jgi:hypothetical protein
MKKAQGNRENISTKERINNMKLGYIANEKYLVVCHSPVIAND